MKYYALALIIMAGGISASWAADRNILWDKVHNQCDVNYTNNGLYAPCALVDKNNGYVFYKVDFDKYQYLLMPLKKITGVEDPQLLDADLPRYLWMAWWGRDLVSEKTGRTVKEKDLSVTINPVNSRSQDQLHLHISCLAQPVRAALDSISSWSSSWAEFPQPLQGNTWQYRKVTLEELQQKNLFKEINDQVVAMGKEMQYTTIALLNIDNDDFLLLAASGDSGKGIAAETLQDHECAVAAQ